MRRRPGEAYRRELADEPPDLLIVDHRLGKGETGIQLVHAVHDAVHKSVPALLITGDTAAERLQEASRSGYTLLHKPVSPAQLRVAVNRALA